MQRVNVHVMAIAMVASAIMVGCPENNNANDANDGTESADTNDPCNLGEQNCGCSNGLCYVNLECVNGQCIDTDCTPGTENCQCADGALCLGELACNNGICMSPGGDDCTPQEYFRCSDGDVHWFDACGMQGALKEDCDPVNQNCVNMSDTEAYCVPIGGDGDCPDGNIGPGEDCEGGNLDGQSCSSLGFGGGSLACTAWCTFDTSDCDSCGNNLVDDASEDCDGTDLQGAQCSSFNFDDGDLQCAPNCKYDLSDCTSCDCNGGPCCANGCDFDGGNLECDSEAAIEYACPSGTDPGDDVSVRSRAQYCSGSSESCDGALGSWGGWQLQDDCSWNEVCAPGDSTCNACSFSFDVTQYECNQYSVANGAGPGGGEIMKVCASTDMQNGYMTVKARKYDGATFGNRPYQVRVSSAQDDPCGPATWFFVVSDSDPVGIGSTELTFTFPAQWQSQQWEKAYCVTASTQFGDPGYDGNNSQQQSWWYSKKAVTTRQCN